MPETPNEDDRRQAAVLADHLPEGYSASFHNVSEDPTHPSCSAPDVTQPAEESSLRLQGGDIHRDLFKIDARARGVQRSQTFSHSTRRRDVENTSVMTPQEQLEPQGFRRQHLLQRQHQIRSARLPVTSSFVQFLDLYGSFAGEDLAESDDEAMMDDSEDDDDEDQSQRQQQSERRPLLQRRKTSRASRQGDASTGKTFFTLLKAFVGAGIMFLPKAFNNGGILFSSMTLVAVALISMLAFHLLLQCRERYGGSYGDLGEGIVGPKMRGLILASITLSQLGFVCTGLVFVADNLSSALNAFTNGDSPLSISALIGLQAVIMVPISFVRNISKLGPAAIFADIFIFTGLIYIWYYCSRTLINDGIHPSVQFFNEEAYTLTVGTAIFSFEGIGLILPIQSSMKNPQHFEWLLAVTMFIITILLTSVGSLCYATFGSDTNIEVINNFPQSSRLVNAIQILYAVAILVANPIQLFPALRILEGKIFRDSSGKKDSLTKWKKNGFRTLLVAFCIAISILGSSELDRFVSLIGSFACVPLVYIYPPLLHYKGIAETRKAKTGDILLMGLGIVGMIYTTTVTIKNSFM